MTPRKGETADQFRRRRRDADRQIRAAMYPPMADDVDQQKMMLADLSCELSETKAKLRELEAASRELELAGSLRFKPAVIPVERHEPGSPGFPMTIWSDWHWGEVVDSRETGGLNAFNREIAQKRITRLVNGTINLLRNYAGAGPLPGIWICLGGDMISGGLHEELRETNWGTIEEQAYEVGCALAGALLAMADEFGEVHVPCVVGNHGRHAHKPPAKRKVTENREWGVYMSLQQQFASDERFHFYVPREADFRFEVYGHRFLLTHGDDLGVKGGDGIIGAIGPIQRGNTKVFKAEATVRRDYDTLVIGHWHTYHPRGDMSNVVVNGTLKGFDEYARTRLRVPYSKASQALWLVSPKHGIGAQWPVELQ